MHIPPLHKHILIHSSAAFSAGREEEITTEGRREWWMRQASRSSPSPAHWQPHKGIWVVRGWWTTAGLLDKDCFSEGACRAERDREGSWLRAALPTSSDQLLREWKGRVIKDFSSAYVPQVSSFQKPLESEVTQTVPLNNSNLSRSYSIHKAGPWPWDLLSDNKNCMSKSPFKAASHLLHIKIILRLSHDLPQLQWEESWAPLNWVSSNIRIVISLQCFS